jgi:type I restriction enzyme M protein
LRLNFQASRERLERLLDETAFVNLATSKKKGKAGEQEHEAGSKMQEVILTLLKTLPDRVVKDRSEIEGLLDAAVKRVEIKLSALIKKAIFSALNERDEVAEMCRDKDGNPEPDAELRDYENIPLKEDIHAYFTREVRPHVPEAWIDESKTKVGYEIPFNRHFYQYTPPRPLAEIESDIKAIEQDILEMQREVAG